MDDQRFDAVARALGGATSRRRLLSGVLGAALVGLRPGRLLAQSAGSGGNATASANGGAVVVGAVNPGGITGKVISVGNTWGNVWVDGGDVSNSTTIGLSAGGGTAISDASGGSGNIAIDQGGAWTACNCTACPPGWYCCNWSCGICRRNGVACNQRACNVCHAV